MATGPVIQAGYMGIATFTSPAMTVRFGDCSLNAKQSVEAPDMVMGDLDHDAYVYGKIEVGGSMGGPMTETFVNAGAGSGLWDFAVKRNIYTGQLSNTSDISIVYYDGRMRKFSGMLCNSVGMSCAAGDIANWTMDLVGVKSDAYTVGGASSRGGKKTTSEKLITWDRVKIEIDPRIGAVNAPGAESITNTATTIRVPYSNIDFNIANNVTPIYAMTKRNSTATALDLYPYQVITGLRTISGTLSIYNAPEGTGQGGIDAWGDLADAGDVAQLKITISGKSTDLVIPIRCQFHRPEIAAAVSPVTTTITFTGVTHQPSTGTPSWPYDTTVPTP